MAPIRISHAPGRDAVLVARDDIRVLSPAHAEGLVDAVLAQPGGQAQLQRLVDGPPDASIEDLRAHAIDVLSRGDLIAVRLDRSRRLDEPTFIEPGTTDPTGPTGPVIERPTWISIELILEDGALVPGLAMTLTAPDGSIRDLRLDADSRFRADDIPNGDGGCTLRLHAHGGLASAKTITFKDDDVFVDPGAPFSVELACARHHRLVVVEGKTEIQLIDSAGKPVKDKRCRVVVDGRMHEGRTDREGLWVVHHLRNAEVCAVEFPGVDRGGWDLLEKDGGAR